MSREAASRADETGLRRALWRWEYGRLSATRVRRLLRAAYLRTARAFDALEGAVPAVRRHAPALLARRDAFRARGDDALRRGAWREALHQVLDGRRALGEMQALSDAADALGEAEAAVRELRGRATAPSARALPCLRAPAALLEGAGAWMDAGRWSQAASLARAAMAECAPLGRRERDAGRAAVVEARLAELGALCDATRAVAGDGAFDPAADGALAEAAALARDGHLALAGRMADELAFALEARRRFHRELRRDGAHPLPPSPAGAETADPWAGATAALWRRRLEAGLARAGAQRARLERARASLETPARAVHPPPTSPR